MGCHTENEGDTIFADKFRHCRGSIRDFIGGGNRQLVTAVATVALFACDTITGDGWIAALCLQYLHLNQLCFLGFQYSGMYGCHGEGGVVAIDVVLATPTGFAVVTGDIEQEGTADLITVVAHISGDVLCPKGGGTKHHNEDAKDFSECGFVHILCHSGLSVID